MRAENFIQIVGPHHYNEG